MQIGNFHFGKAETATPPSITIMEAALIWDMLTGRYKCIRETQIYYSYAHDKDWKEVLNYGISFLENQARTLEQQAKTYKLPMPDRPPLDAPYLGNSAILNDRLPFYRFLKAARRG